MARGSLNTPYLLLTGAIVIGIVAVFALYQPMLSDITQAQGNIESKQATLAEKEAFVRNLDQKIAELQVQSQHEQQLNVILPTEDSIEDMIRIVHEAGIASGGTVQKVDNASSGLQTNTNSKRARGEQVDIPAGVTPLGFAIEFTGTYQQLRIFLEQLETAPRLNDVTRMSINRDAQQLDRVNAQINLQFYKHATSTQ